MADDKKQELQPEDVIERLQGKWYEQRGAVHTGTRKYDFFPFTCGYMMKKI